MEVILNQDIDKLGKAGSVVKVKEGYARNFLIPRRLAVALTQENLKRLELEREKKNAQLLAKKKEAQELKDKLSSVSLTIPVLVQEDETLYGSITAQDIAAALKEEGLELDKTLIQLNDVIKSLGIYEVPVRLHPEVSVNIKVWIVKK